jgi:predicted DNA-binding protein YlxM (UPF0122 family)
MTQIERARLRELKNSLINTQHEFDDYIVSLYEQHVSQQSIAGELKVTQSAVHLRIRRRYDWLAAHPVVESST